MARVSGLLACLAMGCRTGPPAAAPIVDTPIVAAARAEPEDPCLPDSWRPSLEVPAHADPSFDPDTGLLADVVRWGPVFPAADAPTILADDVELLYDDEFEPFTARVLDVGEGPDDRRLVHLLCDEPEARIGLWHVARELRRTNRSHALLVALPGIPKSIDDETPGVRLPPGTANVPRLGDPSVVRAVYDFDYVRAEGFIDAALVDVVYESDPRSSSPYLVDGELVVASDVEVRDAPEGFTFARIEPSSWRDRVRQLDAKGDSILVRYTNDEVTVVGWIAAWQFEARPASIIGQGKGGGGGRGLHGGHSTHLERGTLLVHEASETVLGVVLEAGEFRCEGRCEEPAPRVEVIACDYLLGVRAIRPLGSERLCPADASG